MIEERLRAREALREDEVCQSESCGSWKLHWYSVIVVLMHIECRQRRKVVSESVLCSLKFYTVYLELGLMFSITTFR